MATKTFKKAVKEEPVSSTDKAEADVIRPAEDTPKSYKLFFSFKNGASLEKSIRAKESELSAVLDNILSAMKNPSLHGSIHVTGSIIDISQITFVTVEEVADEQTAEA